MIYKQIVENGEKSQSHHCQTSSKDIKDKTKKVVIRPAFLNSHKAKKGDQHQTKSYQPTGKKNPRPKQVFPNPKNNQIYTYNLKLY